MWEAYYLEFTRLDHSVAESVDITTVNDVIYCYQFVHAAFIVWKQGVWRLGSRRKTESLTRRRAGN